MTTRHSFAGNPNTNDAARYSEMVRRWRANGCHGPRPLPPPSVAQALQRLAELNAKPPETTKPQRSLFA